MKLKRQDNFNEARDKVSNKEYVIKYIKELILIIIKNQRKKELIAIIIINKIYNNESIEIFF